MSWTPSGERSRLDVGDAEGRPRGGHNDCQRTPRNEHPLRRRTQQFTTASERRGDSSHTTANATLGGRAEENAVHDNIRGAAVDEGRELEVVLVNLLERDEGGLGAEPK
eukprot:6939108-Pyramimonas_sp.AAC.1